MTRIWAGILASLTACHQPADTLGYGEVRTTLAPTDDGGATAVEAWSLFADPSGKHGATYLCGAVVVYDMRPDNSGACLTCDVALHATKVTVTDTDCGDLGWEALPDALRGTRGYGLGAAQANLGTAPNARALTAWRQNAVGDWIAWGWGWADRRPDVSAWNGRAPFTLTPHDPTTFAQAASP